MKVLFNYRNCLLITSLGLLICISHINSNSIRKLETESSLDPKSQNNTSGIGTTSNSTSGGSSINPATIDNKNSLNKSDLAPVNPGLDINITIPNKTEEVYEDKLVVKIYNSTLTKEQREEYLFWVKYKNSFNTNADQLAKMTKYFAPEDPDYYQMVFASGWPLYSLAGIFSFALLIYLIFRFLFGQFLGPKSHITNWYVYFSYSLICKN
jgi:hypothetical protein